ncbi:hypothetical protein [Butyrivibrio sp. AE2015]|uniref:hypothetical protein n=1 Tax=Butyrivibrio sp. AE2015 TaxID=1280663 RepID=UPI0003B6F60D|nr:hypothetical protein [Butyrivibrio sp. AE2015]
MKKSIVAVLFAIVTAEALLINKYRKRFLKQRDEYLKFTEFYQLLLQWVRNYRDGKHIKSYFEKNDFKSVAIYGMKELGISFLEQCEREKINVKYCIDRDADSIHLDVDVYKPDTYFGDVDVIVVTAIHNFCEIECSLKKKTSANIVSLEDVIWEL